MGVIFYQITHNRKTKHITTRLRIEPSKWSTSRNMPLENEPNHAKILVQINNDLTILQGIILDLNNSKQPYTVEEIRDRFNSSNNQTLIIDYIQVLIRQLQKANRLGTAKNYEKTLRSFRSFLGGSSLPLSALSEQVIMDYNSFLINKGLVRNSTSFYMRTLRAIYNKAVKQKLAEQIHPFTDVYTGIDKTRKRAVPESVITQLYNLELPDGSPIAFARDLFIFSYCTRGMAFVDIAYLQKSDIENGMIYYTRRKTGQRLAIKIEPSIQRIINRYTSLNSPYIFPILTSTSPSESYEEYKKALNNHNRLLGRLSKISGYNSKLTTYTPRHSWATSARNHNIPISIISQGMGHSSERTTQIYLEMLETSLIDEANHKIVSRLEQEFHKRTPNFE